MLYTTLLFAATTALLACAQDGLDIDDPTLGYYQDVCAPLNSTGYPDMNAPCNEVIAVETQCIFGPSDGLAYFFASFPVNSTTNTILRRQEGGLANGGGDDDGDNGDDDLPMQSNSTQRVCICESQFFDLITGCEACFTKHGAPDGGDNLPAGFVSSLSSSYCAASATPSLGLADYLNNFYIRNVPTTSSSAPATATGTSSASISDPIGNKTAVSLYYTQAVTGSAAWVIAEASATGSSASGSSSGSASGSGSASTLPNSFSSINTVSGQIRPTATGAGGASGSAAAHSGTGTSSAGAMRTEAAAVAGVLGVAGLVALL